MDSSTSIFKNVGYIIVAIVLFTFFIIISIIVTESTMYISTNGFFIFLIIVFLGLYYLYSRFKKNITQ
jgi:hypothetical protein